MRPAPRLALIAGLALLIAPLVLIGALLLWANTAGGRHQIETWTARLSSGGVRITGLSGPLPGRIALGRLELADAQGVWLRAVDLELRWSPLHLLLWRIDVESLRAATLDIERAPQRGSSPPSRQGGGPSLPTIGLRELTVSELVLGEALAGERSAFSVQGSGRYRDLEELAARIDVHRRGGAGQYQLDLQSSPERLAARLALDEPAGGPLEHLVGLPGLGALTVKLELQGPHRAEQLALAIRAGELRADARGRLDLDTLAADLDVGITAPAMRPAADLGWEGLSIQGRWHGPLERARASGHVVVLGLSAPGGLRFAQLLGFFDADAGRLRARGSIEELEIPGPKPRLFAAAPVTLAASLGLDAPSRPATLTLHHPALELDAQGTLGAGQHIRFVAHTPDLAPFAALAGQDLAGDVRTEGSITHAAQHLQMQLQARTALRGPGLPGRLLGADTRLSLQAQLAGRDIAIRELRTRSAVLALEARGTLRRAASGGSGLEHLRLQGNLELPRLAALSPQLEGSLRAGATLEGPPTALAAELRVDSQLSVRGSPPGKLAAVLRARGLPSAPTGTLEGHGSFDGAPLHLVASAERREPGMVHVVLHHTAWKSLQAAADLTSGAELERARGSLELHVGRIADLQRLLGPDLQGRLDASLALLPGRQGTQARVQLQALDLRAAGLQGELHLAGNGPTTALQLALQARSPSLGGGPVTLEARGRANLVRRSLELQAASAGVHGESVRLLAPAHLETRPELRIDTLRLGARKAELTLAGTLAPALDVRARLQGLDAQLVDAFVPDLIDQGRLEASAELHGTPAAPQGSARLSIAGLKLANETAHELPAADLEVNAQLQGATAAVDARLTGGRAARLQLAGSVPLTGAGALDVAITGRIDAGIANPLLEAEGRRAAGTLSIDVRAAGALGAPQLSGSAQLTHGDLRDYAQGVHLADIGARLTGEQGRLRLVSLSGRAGAGEFTASGTLGVLEPALPLDLAIHARHAQPVNSDILTANVDADLTVKGSLRERLDLAGRIDVNRAEVGIPNGLPPNVAVLDVRRRGAAVEAETETRRVIGLALTVHAPRQVLVRGRGLDAELGGDVSINGTSADPEVSGGFELIRGSFALASTQLQFSRGEVSFNGAGLRGRIDPTLDFAAQSQVADTTVQLTITGLADAPSFELSSTPQLPQDEILARLLFGQSAAQLSALQVAQIGAALASLSGVGGGGGGLNPLARLQKALGLDRLSVGGAGTANNNSTPAQGAQQNALGATVTAGRYVSPRVFVAASQSTTGASQLQVDVDLTRRLKLRTRLGNGTATAQGTTPENDPGSSIGLSWQYEY